MAVIRLTPDANGSIGRLKLQTGQYYRIVLVKPKIVRVRLIGMFFDLDKCFLLPSAMNGIRKIRSIYDEHPDGRLLVVGHTDTSGSPSVNDTLALERSRAVVAYLTDAVDTWLPYYTDKVAAEKRWGSREDGRMLSVLPEGEEPYLTPDKSLDAAVRRFQEDHGLKVDGIAGPKTRRALVSDYMSVKDTSLPTGATIVAHGCGENFPEVATEDNVKDPRNRRVEIFVFDGPIDPAPASEQSDAKSTDYPAWVKRVSDTVDFSTDDDTRVPVTLDDPFLGILTNLAVTATYASGLQEELETDAHGAVDVLLDQGDHVDLAFTTTLREHIVRVFPNPEPVTSEAGAWQRLVNLGYAQEPAPLATPAEEMDLQVAVSDFQASHGITPSGLLDDETCAAIDEAHASALTWSEQPQDDLPDDKFDASASLPKDAIA